MSVQPTTMDDMIEAAVLQREEQLDAQAATSGSSEGPRFPVTLNIGGQIVEVTDQTEEEKQAAARQANEDRVKRFEEETFRVAKFKLNNMSAVEAVDTMAEMAPGDREIYLRAEAAGKNRKEIFEVFGRPESE